MKKIVIFSIDEKKNIFSSGYFIKPVNDVAYYFCLLIKRDTLSVKDLYVIEKLGMLIGFKVKLIRKRAKEVPHHLKLD